MFQRSRILAFVCTATFSLISVFAQGQTGGTPATPPAGGGATTPPGGGTPGGVPTTPGNNRPTNQFPQPGQRQPQFDSFENRPIFLSGKVMMDNGGPPSEPVTIERICAGRGNPVPEGYTDSKGRFSFQVGQRMGMMPDASMGNTNDDPFASRSSAGAMNPGQSRVSERDLMSCELRASLPGHRSTVVTLAGRRSLDNPDVGTIILRRLGDVTGFTTSATSLMAPKDAKKALENARKALKKNKIPDAQKELETAVNLHPKYAEAFYELGRVRSLQNDADGARSNYLKSIEADDKFINPYLGIALMDAQLQKWAEVKETTAKVIKLNRYDFPSAFFYGAVANYNLQDREEAEKLCRGGLEIDQYHRVPKMAHLLGLLLAEKQEFKAASDQLKAYLQFAPKAADADTVRKQLADFEGRIAQATPPKP